MKTINLLKFAELCFFIFGLVSTIYLLLFDIEVLVPGLVGWFIVTIIILIIKRDALLEV